MVGAVPATRVVRSVGHRITHKRGFAGRGVVRRGRWVAVGGSVAASLVMGDEGSPVR